LGLGRRAFRIFTVFPRIPITQAYLLTGCYLRGRGAKGPIMSPLLSKSGVVHSRLDGPCFSADSSLSCPPGCVHPARYHAHPSNSVDNSVNAIMSYGRSTP
jgi:hypothetical protein